MRVLVMGVLVACHGSGPAATTGTPSGSGSACAAKLDELAQFYDAVARDNASATPRPGSREGEMQTGFETLPEITGVPSDLTKADVLLVGPRGIELVTASGETRRLDAGGMIDHVDAPDATRQLVIEIDERVPWQRIEDVRQALGKTDAPYTSLGVAYRVAGARAGRVPPKVPGAGSDGVDLPAIGDAIAKTTAAHCPEYAKQLAALQSGGMVTDPELLRSLARTIPHCDCAVDTALLETLPWLVARPVVTVVPLAKEAPPLHAADAATWGDLVRDAKGAVPMAMPPPLPPPPPPPPHHRR